MEKSNIRKIAEIMEVSKYKADIEYPVFTVMSYQRGYRWGEDRAQQLLEDIYNNYKKYYTKIKDIEENDADICGYEYCIQPLVVKKVRDEEIDGVVHPVYNVIDGQQRLTTLYLIFCAMNKEYDNNKIYRNHDDKVHISYKRNADSSFDVDKFIGDDVDEKMLSIDERYARNVYLFIQKYINEKVLSNTEKYFEFTGKEKNPNIDYTKDRLERFNQMIQFYTTIIWYEPSTSDEDAFDIFNDKKIPLTGSELVKALFMNPDNYIVPGSAQSYSNDLIKTRQIVIGNEWDKMEQLLHNEDFWHFFPHNKDMHKITRMDALIDFYVYVKLNKNNRTDIDNSYLNDDKFAYKELERLILEDLKQCKTSKEKFDRMEGWWKEIRDLFDIYWSIFSPYQDENETKLYAVYHRVSVLQYIDRIYFEKITRKSGKLGYLNQLKNNSEWISIMDFNNTEKQILELNKEICKRIDDIFKNKSSKVFSCILKNGELSEIDKGKCDTLDKKIRALTYDSDNILIRIFLVIHSLYELEKNISMASRFSFREFELKEGDGYRWVSEHIFAKRTSVTEESEKEKIVENIAVCGWEDYIEFKYENILDDSIINKIIDTKKYYIDTYFTGYDDLDPEEKEMIWNNQCTYDADTIEPENDTPFCGFFKDNSMGNMGLIRKGDNSSVGNYTFGSKKSKIMEKFTAGSFIPSGTYSMFTGVYCDNFDSTIWYPCHRKKYLKNLIQAINDYLN